jgi:1-acyl-sn-glycerol-3-phosphate acyltransferase
MTMFVNALIALVVVVMLFVLEFGVVVQYVVTAPRSSRDYLCARYEQIGAAVILRLFRAFRGFSITVSNPKKLEIPDHCLVISNHQSLLDILVLIWLLGIERKPRFVAKKELQYGIPLVSFTLRKGGHCLVRRRGEPIEAMRAVSNMAERCKRERTCPVIFPEGTRSRNGKLGIFHSAGVRKILDVESVPVAAIAIDGGWKVATIRGFLRRFGKEPYIAEIVKIYDPPRGKREIEVLLADARAQIAEHIETMRRR